MRKLILSFWLVLLLVPSASLVRAQTDGSGCSVRDQDIPAACRQFMSDNGFLDGEPFLFLFSAYSLDTELGADSFLNGFVPSLSRSLNMTSTSIPYHFGDDQQAFTGKISGSDQDVNTGLVVFRSGTTLVAWIVGGPNLSPFEALFSVYGNVEPRIRQAVGASQSIAAFMPEHSDLPPGFELESESYSASFDMTALKRGEPAATEETNTDLKATISALETQAAAKESAPTKVAKMPTEAPKVTSSGPLEILDITTKDAGIGDGSLYAYVEVRNVTNKTLNYVMVDATCRDSSGSVVSTGIGNALNLAPGESTVLTVIFLSSPTCEHVEVKTNPLTGAF